MITQRTNGCCSHLQPGWNGTLIVALALSCGLLHPSACFALGFRIPNQDAEATARGNAFTATADNPSAIYYNPAGIAFQPGLNAQYGAHIISINSEYHSFSGSSANSKFEIQPVPQLYITYMPSNSTLAYGVGVYAPFGLGLEWPENSSFRSLAVEGRMLYANVNPVVAWKPASTFSISAGPTLNYSKVNLRQGLGLAPGDQFQYKGDDFGFGFNAGLLWQPLTQLSFGATYRSASTMNYSGTANSQTIPGLTGSARTKVKVDFPQFVIAGVSYRPTPDWNIEVNVDWTDWDVVKVLTFEGTRQIYGSDVQLPLNWKASWLYELGVTRQLGNGWFVSGGYFFSQNSSPDRNFTPSIPDTDLHVGSLGFGKRSQHWHWAVSGQIITGPARTVRNSQSTSLVGETADGTYKWFNQAVNFSIGYLF
ncbi:MAG TPA: outer membrane protein transport protein [Candidatus Saccharimonadales bacterium]|nr:outer membrane protein transport protein [Candidatus Saccharimonadales bacterium]